MIHDAYIVWKKEIRELVSSYTGVTSFIFRYGIFLAFFGVFLPLRQGDIWRDGLVPGIIFASIPFFISNWFVADSIAGERERKTLETLLATRLSSPGILMGKIAAALTLSWIFTNTAMIISLIVLNSTYTPGSLILYPPATVFCATTVSIGTGLFITITGIFISMKASSVRQAQQSLGIPIMLFFLFVGFLLPEIVEHMPETAGVRILSTLSRIASGELAILGMILLLVMDGLLFVILNSKFTRPALMEDS